MALTRIQQRRIVERSIGSERSHTMTPIVKEPETTATDEPERKPRWELAECNCPDWCERDHERD
jgi:hypothetical protein